jgi:hypothetical protein
MRVIAFCAQIQARDTFLYALEPTAATSRTQYLFPGRLPAF